MTTIKLESYLLLTSLVALVYSYQSLNKILEEVLEHLKACRAQP